MQTSFGLRRHVALAMPLRPPKGHVCKLSAQPLRNAQSPEDLPHLSGVDSVDGRRVRLANQLYMFSAQVLELCVQLGKVCVLENPSPAWFWSTCWMLPWTRMCVRC